MKNDYASPEIELIIAKNPENKFCIDCGNETECEWVSLNNALFLCLECAGIHRSLGVKISTIRSLIIDDWDTNQLLLLKVGGNKRFLAFLDEFQSPKDSTFQNKYSINATEYYRQIVTLILNLVKVRSLWKWNKAPKTINSRRLSKHCIYDYFNCKYTK